MALAIADDWISDEAFRAELARIGCHATDGQLEDWRGDGLIRPRPIQKPSNYNGSEVWHAPTEAGQALAIQRVLAAKNRKGFAGEVLWSAGYEVDERYWRDSVRKADALFQRGARIARRVQHLLDRAGHDRTFGDIVAPMTGLKGALHKMTRRLSDDEQSRAANLALEVVGGEFVAGDLSATDVEIVKNTNLLESVFGFENADKQVVLGATLNLKDCLSDVLEAIAGMQAETDALSLSDEEIFQARDDLRNAMKVIVCFYEGLAWISGVNAFALRFANFMVLHQSGPLIFMLTCGFARLRRKNALLSSGEIAIMARQSEGIWLISTYYKDLAYHRPEIEHLIGRERIKAAVKDSVQLKNWVKQLSQESLPDPEFHPWDNWRKLMPPTISSGLLAMSIGAPESRSLAAVLESASA
jgi:hypothetical protein